MNVYNVVRLAQYEMEKVIKADTCLTNVYGPGLTEGSDSKGRYVPYERIPDPDGHRVVKAYTVRGPTDDGQYVPYERMPTKQS